MMIARAPAQRLFFRHVIALVIAFLVGLILTIFSIAAIGLSAVRTIGEWLSPIGIWLWGDLIKVAIPEGGPAAYVALIVLTYWPLWFAVTYALCVWRFRLLPP